MKAQALRRALIEAIARLPASCAPVAKRQAARKWHHEVTKCAFENRRSFAKHEIELLRNILPGSALNPQIIKPEIIPCRSDQDFLTFAYFSLWSSFPTVDRPGRRMKFLIRDVG